MARFNEILAGRLNRAVQKFTGIKAGAPTPQLATEFIPIFPMFWGAENRYLESWFRFGFASFFSAVAGDVNATRLRNPPNSGVVAVFEKIMADNNGTATDTATLSVGPATTDFSVLSLTGARFDPRGNPNSALILSISQAPSIAAPSPSRAGVSLLINTFYEFISTDIQEITLLPGDALQVASTTVNNSQAQSFWWRERVLEDSEKF